MVKAATLLLVPAATNVAKSYWLEVVPRVCRPWPRAGCR